MRWIMDRFMVDRANQSNTGLPTLEQAARELGHDVYVIGREEDFSTIPYDNSAPVVTWGSHQFVTKVEQQKRGWIPGTYHKTNALAYSSFASHLGGELLNDDFIILPYVELKRRKWDHDIFIRPNAVTKTFAGFSIKKEEIERELSALDQIEHVWADTLVVVAKAKPIKAEFRFVIVNGAVVTGSEYRWGNKLDIRIDVHPACLAHAQRVARRAWQPDVAYTCDIALLEDDQTRIVELNTFSCSGMYACDMRLVASKIAEAALMEFNGDIP